MASKHCTKRLQGELKALQKDPVEFFTARPSSNILEWHFALEGPKDTPFEGGIYHGLFQFQPDYPFKAPDVKFVTPNGRFDLNKKICFSFTSYHQETWNPAWTLRSMLIGILSFMTDDKEHTAGAIVTNDTEKQQFAKQSMSVNVKNKTFCDMFPEIVEQYNVQLAQQQA